jgi:hypothetical protein
MKKGPDILICPAVQPVQFDYNHLLHLHVTSHATHAQQPQELDRIFRAHPAAPTTFALENLPQAAFLDFMGQYPTSVPSPFYNAVESFKYQQWVLPLDSTFTPLADGDPAYRLTFPPVAAVRPQYYYALPHCNAT